jgi:hypothetical protein
MKSLAGANPDARPDYRGQALTELNKLEQKVILLNEMLDNVDTQIGEKFVSGDVYDVCESNSSCICCSLDFFAASCFHSLKCSAKDTKMDIRRGI